MKEVILHFNIRDREEIEALIGFKFAYERPRHEYENIKPVEYGFIQKWAVMYRLFADVKEETHTTYHIQQ